MAEQTRIPRINNYDFKRVSKNDMDLEQNASQGIAAANFDAVAGSGVLLEFPQEPIIFDSDDLDSFQQGLYAISTFDGQGVLSSAYTATDTVGGAQLALTMTGARLDGFLSTTVFILGKTFDQTLIYEVIELGNNVTEISKNHFIEVTNIMFQNLRGNLNTTVDGYGCFDVGGRLVIAEASSMRPTRDSIIVEKTNAPQINFAKFKTANAGKSLSTTVEEAIGSSNDIDDLDINTTVASTRDFTAGAATDVVYAQKFEMKGNNIQKITLLLSLESGNSWSGNLVIGIRPLQTSTTYVTDFLPDDEIGFDPSTEPLEEVSVNQDDLELYGVVLDTSVQPVDFFFTGSNISNSSLSGLIEGNYYAITIRRTGSSATGTIQLQEATNSDTKLRLTVFDNSIWTDVSSSSLWFRVWGDAARVASGIAYDDGIRLVTPKTTTDNNGVEVQNFTEDYDFVNTSEDAENYLIVQQSTEYTTPESHPRTGDLVYSRKEDAPEFSMLEQSSVFTLLTAGDETVLLARLRDRNARSNPTISGTTNYPGLALGNVFTILDPGTDLLNQNVVGSILIPNTAKPTLKYRITSQTTYTDLIGDTNLDGVVDVADAARIVALDGYAADLSSGTVAAATQLAAVRNGDTSVAEIIRADVNGSGFVSSIDSTIINSHINDGYALPAGSTLIRMELEVEALTSPISYLTSSAVSTLALENSDTDFINNTTFAAIPYRIDFLESWKPENIEVLDLRRYVSTTFLDFDSSDLTASTENGGQNNLFASGDMYLSGSVKELDGTFHPLDFERNTIEIELPAGDTAGEFNVFETLVVSKMRFSDGTLVANTALTNSQVKFDVSIASHVKDLDGYDYDGYGGTSDESIGTYMNHATGLFRIKATNIVNNTFLPQVRTRIVIGVSLKKAGFANSVKEVDPTELGQLLT